jgi:hypothetical protein
MNNAVLQIDSVKTVVQSEKVMETICLFNAWAASQSPPVSSTLCFCRSMSVIQTARQCQKLTNHTHKAKCSVHLPFCSSMTTTRSEEPKQATHKAAHDHTIRKAKGQHAQKGIKKQKEILLPSFSSQGQRQFLVKQ